MKNGIDIQIKDEYHNSLKITDDRVVLHSDLNNFFASVETLLEPSLKDVPMAVCGNEKERHGIILAKNEKAKRYGIKTGETVKSAREKCAELVTRPSRYPEYVKYSRCVREVYLKYTPLVEPFGIDEAWLDVSAFAKRRGGVLFEQAQNIAEEIKAEVYHKTGLSVSVGVSFNKIFSKLASDMKKTGCPTVISPDNFRSVIGALPVREILYVGRKTEEVLKRNRFFTLADVARQRRSYLKQIFGKFGETVWDFANGHDFSPVSVYTPKEETDSVSNSRTLPYDITNFEDAQSVLFSLCESVCERIKERGMFCKTVRISVRTQDLHTITRQAKRNSFTDSVFEIFSDVSRLLRENVDFSNPVRSLGVALEDLQSASFEQVSVFDTQVKKNAVDAVLDSLREKYGDGSVKRARDIVKRELSHFDKKHPAFNHNL